MFNSNNTLGRPRWPALQRLSMVVVTGAAAVVIVAAGAIGLNLLINQQTGIGGASPSPSAAAASPGPTATPGLAPTSGGMWPQSTLEEVRAAQERAAAGDPDSTWQLDPQLAESILAQEPGQIEIADRFLREVLGWEAYMLQEMGQRGVDDVYYLRYLRCEPGRANPLYPGEGCAPTLDDLHYESVTLDLAQPVVQDGNGIWVVNGWGITEPFEQADPVAVEEQATQLLEEFLAARIAGTGAEARVTVDSGADVPLLYATSTGAPYERYEIERLEGPDWPNGYMLFSARLFADGDATVVEQVVRSDIEGGLWMNATSTTENGQPIVLSYTSPDGEVSVSALSTWTAWIPGSTLGETYSHVWFGMLWPTSDPDSDSSQVTIGLVDPVAYDSWCEDNGGSPLLSGAASAAEIAQQLTADPNFETTEPVDMRIGGLDGLSMDVALAAGGEACGVGIIEISRWVHELGWDQDLRQRLYLIDLPEGMSMDTLAITVNAPQDRFEEIVAETEPIIESIEFHPVEGTTNPSEVQ